MCCFWYQNQLMNVTTHLSVNTVSFTVFIFESKFNNTSSHLTLPVLFLLYLQVGFFPSECVELINDKVPQSMTNTVPKPGTLPPSS